MSLKKFFTFLAALVGLMLGAAHVAQAQNSFGPDSGSASWVAMIQQGDTDGLEATYVNVIVESGATFSIDVFGDSTARVEQVFAYGPSLDTIYGSAFSHEEYSGLSAGTYNFAFLFSGNPGNTLHYGATITAAIPEPSTYALMLAGLAAVSFMAKRRRRGVPLPS